MHLRSLYIGLSLVAAAACTASQQKPEASNAANQIVLQAYVDAWNNHDTTAIDTLLAPNGTHEDIAQRFLGHGGAEVNRFLAGMISVMPDFKWTITGTFASGNTIAAEWTWTSTYTGPSPNGPVKDLPTTGRGVSIGEMENGKIKHLTDYYDNASFFPAPADTTKKS